MKRDIKLNLVFMMVPLILMFVVVIGVTYAIFTQDIDTDEVITIKTGDQYVGIYGEGKDNIMLGEDYTFTIENKGIRETGYELYMENSTSIDLSKIQYEITGDETITGSLDAEKILVGNLEVDQKIVITFKVTSEETSDYVGEIKVRTTDYKVNGPTAVRGMIPVTFDGTNWVKTSSDNLNNSWYDYNDKKWANVVTIKDSVKRQHYDQAEDGTVVEMDDINSFFVWIPRFSYTLGGDYGMQVDGAGTPSKETPGAFDIKFIDVNITDNGSGTYTGATPDQWYTPLAFCFGDSCATSRADDGNIELAGIWVSKFELTGTVQSLSSIPNEESLRNLDVATFYQTIQTQMNGENGLAEYGLLDNYDAHMIKNSEWSVISYLAQSKYGKYDNDKYDGANKEVYQNKSDKYITGCSYGSPSSGIDDFGCQYRYGATSDGEGASSTGNIFGVYDLVGGAGEYVMANLNQISGASVEKHSGFTGNSADNNKIEGLEFPALRYYNLYTSTDSSNACNNAMCKGENLFHTKGWYQDTLEFVTDSKPWLVRGGSYKSEEEAGIFYVGSASGEASEEISTRVSLVHW